MILCCSGEWNVSKELPFWKAPCLIFDYYDGPLEGVVECNVCGQCYYYKLLSWNENTQDSRVFEFIKIERPHEVEDQSTFSNEMPFHFKQQLLLRMKERILEKMLPHRIVSNFCLSDDHFHTGVWRKSPLDGTTKLTCLCPPAVRSLENVESEDQTDQK